jgi:hypothetical protein
MKEEGEAAQGQFIHRVLSHRGHREKDERRNAATINCQAVVFHSAFIVPRFL